MLMDQKEQIWVSSMEKIDNSKFEIIKVNINPYAYIVDSGFENVNEDMVVNNKTYHVFKNRIRNNVLELYCLKNSNQSKISKDLRNSVDNHLFNNSKESPTKKTFKSFLMEYISNDFKGFDLNYEIESFAGVNIFSPKMDLLSGFCTPNYSPPDFV
jgi:hypothetical protein